MSRYKMLRNSAKFPIRYVRQKLDRETVKYLGYTRKKYFHDKILLIYSEKQRQRFAKDVKEFRIAQKQWEEEDKIYKHEVKQVQRQPQAAKQVHQK